MSLAIEIANLEKRFGAKVAVRSLTLAIAEGEVFGLLGPNGAGKSTTLRLVLGLLAPTGGRVQVLGRTIRVGTPMSGDVGAMIDRPALYPHLNADEHLSLAAWMAGRRALPEQRASQLQLVGLDPRDRRPARAYSTGMKQRLGLGIALLLRPRVLVLDEPTDGLDPTGIVDVRQLINRLREDGVTVLLSSHLLTEVERVCTRIGILMDGSLVANDRPDALVGGSARITLRLTSDDEAIRAASTLGTAAYPSSAVGRSLEVTAEPERAAAVISLLASAGITPADVRVSSGSLEDLYLRLASQHPIGPTS